MVCVLEEAPYRFRPGLAMTELGVDLLDGNGEWGETLWGGRDAFVNPTPSQVGPCGRGGREAGRH